MATNVGSVSVRVVPDATQFVRDLRRDLDSPADRLGKELGKKLGAEAGDGINKSIRDALGDVDSGDLRKSGGKIGSDLGASISRGVGAGFKQGVADAKKQLDSELSGFAKQVNKSVTNALNALPSRRTVSFGVDTKELGKALDMLRALQSKRVGVDIETGRAIADANRIIEKLREIDRTQTRAEVKADIQNAIRELESLRRYAAKSGEDSGREYGGAFERTVRGALQRAGSAINIRPEFDGSEVNSGLANIQRQMAQLRDKRIGVDIDAGQFEAEYANIRSKLAQLAGQSADINVRADAAAALAELYAVNDYLEKLDGKTARANVTVDDGGTAYAVDTNISRLLNRLLLFGSAAGGISSVIGPLLALGAAAGVAGAAVGAAALAFGGIGDAVSALNDQQKEAATSGDDLAKKQAQQAGAIANAQARVAQATRQAGNVREQVASQAAKSAAAVRDAEQRVAQAREKAAADDAKSAAAIVQAQARVAAARETAAENAAESARRIAQAQAGVAKAERTAADNAIDSAQSIRNARRAVADASEQAARNVQAALSRVSQAERSLSDAQRDARRAQEDLTDAREEARRSLLDMRDAVAGNVLSQRRNALDLIEAEQELAKVRSDPTATDLQRARAQLAYDEAVQQSRELRREGQELGRDYADASRKGVEGSDQVVTAQERVGDATRAVSDAQREVGEAQAEVARARRDGAREIQDAQEALANAERAAARQRRDDLEAISEAQAEVGEAQAAAAKQARDDARSIAEAQAGVREAEAARAQQARDSARQIRDAEEALADARRNQADQARQGANQILEADENVKDAQRQLAQAYQTTGDEGKKAADKVAEAFAGLSPAAADFARYLFSLKPLLDRLRATAATELFPQLTQGMQTFLRNFGGFEANIGRLAGSAGLFAERLLTKLADDRWMQFWDRVSYAADGVAVRAAQSFDNAGWAVAGFFDSLLPVNSIGFDALDALSDFFRDLSGVAPQIAVPLTAAFIDMLRNLNPLIPALAALAPVMAELGRILSLGVGAALIAITPGLEAFGVVLGFVADMLELIPEPLRAILAGLIAFQLLKVIMSDMRLASRFAKDSLTDLNTSAGTLSQTSDRLTNQTSKASAALLRGGSAATIANKAMLNYGGASGVARMSAVELGAEQDRLAGKIRAQGRQWLGLRAAVLAQVEATRWARSAWAEVQEAYARGAGQTVPTDDGGQRMMTADENAKRIEERNQRIAESSKKIGDAIRRVPDAYEGALSRGATRVSEFGKSVVRSLDGAAVSAGLAGQKLAKNFGDGVERVDRAVAGFGNRMRDSLGKGMLAAGLFSEGVRNSFRQATESPEAFRQAVTRSMDRAGQTLTNAGARARDFGTSVADTMKTAKVAVDNEVDRMFNRLDGLARDAATRGRDIGKGVIDGARDMADKSRQHFDNVRTSMETSAIRGAMAWNDAAGRMSRYFQNLTTDVGTYRDAQGRLRDDTGRFSKEAAQSGESVRNVFRNLANDAGVLVNRVGLEAQAAGERMGRAWDGARDTTTRAWGGIRQAATDGAWAVRTAVSTGLTGAVDAIPRAIDGARAGVSTAMTGIRTAISNGVDGSITAFGRLRDIGAGGIRSALDGIAREARNAFDGLGRTVENGVGGARRAIDSLGLAASGAARGGVTALKTVLMGTTTGGGLIGALGGGWGIAIMGVVTALGFLADAQQKNAQKAAEHRTNLDNLRGSLDQVTGATTRATLEQTANRVATEKLGDTNETASQIAQRLGISTGDVTRAMLGQQPALDAVNRRLMEQARQNIEGSGAWRNYRRELDANGLTMDVLQQAALGNQDAIGKVERAIQIAGGEGTEFGGVLRGLLGDFRNNSGGLQQLGQSIGGANANLRTVQDETLRTRSAIDTIRAAVDNARGSMLTFADSINRNNGAFIEQGPMADQFRAQLDGISGAARDSALAAGELATRNNELGGAAAGAARNMQQSRDAFIENATQAGMTREAAGRLADQMGLIPGVITTQYNQVGVAQADQALGILRGKIESVNNTTGTITLNGQQTPQEIQRLRDLGFTIQTLPDGTVTVTSNTAPVEGSLQGIIGRINASHGALGIQGNPLPANATLQDTIDYINRAKGTAGIHGDPLPANATTQETLDWINRQQAFLQEGANTRPAEDGTRGRIEWINGQWSFVQTGANVSPAEGDLHKFRGSPALRDPASVDLNLNTDPAERAWDGFWNVLTTLPVLGPTIIAARAIWNAKGGIHDIQGMASGGVRRGIATTVAPNTPTVIGDRAKDDEAYIPINKDPRSLAILEATAGRMGYGLTPMASGGILAMAAGGVVSSTGPAASATAPAAADTSTAALPDAAAIAALDAALQALNATLAATTAAVGVLGTALTALNTTATAGVASLSATDLALVTLNLTATTFGTTINSIVIPALTAEAATLNAQTIPAYASHALTLNAQVIPALNALGSTVNGLVIPALSAEAGTLNGLTTPALAANALAVNAQVIPAYTALTGTINAQVIPALTNLTNTVSFIVTPALLAMMNQINVGNIPALVNLATQINTVTVPTLTTLTNTISFQVNPALLAMQNQINLGNIPSLTNLGLSINGLINTALLPLNTNLTTILFPTLTRYQNEIGVLCVQSNQALQDSLGRLRVDMDLTSQNIAVNSQRNRDEMHRTAFEGGIAMDSLRNNMRLTQDAAKFMADMMFNEMGRIRGAVADPIRWAMQFPLGPPGLAASWNTLDDQFKLGKRINPPAPNFARGGIYPGYTPGKDIGYAHVSGGEAIMRPEWTRAMGPSYVAAANKAARAGQINQFLSAPGPGNGTEGDVKLNLMKKFPIDNHGGARNQYWGAFAPGGVAPHVAAASDEVERIFGRMPGGVGGIGGRSGASDHPSGFALDFMTLNNMALGDRVAAYVEQHAERLAVKYIIWRQRINQGRGWRMMEDRGSPTANHMDHPHVSFEGGPLGGTWGDGPEGGGAGFFDPTPIVNEAFKKAEDFAAELPGRFGNTPFSQGVGGVAGQTISAIKAKAIEQLTAMFGATGGVMGATGADAPTIIRIISDVARSMFGPDARKAAITGVATGLVESNLTNIMRAVDHDSLGVFQQRPSQGWGTPEQVTNVTYAASAFFRRFPRGWQNMEQGALAQSIQRSAFPDKYATRLGQAAQLVAQHGGFDSGGIAVGSGFMPKFINEPERVLSPQQTRSFDTLVHAISEKDLLKAVTPQAPSEASRVFNVYPRENQSEMSIATAVRRIDSFQSRLR